MTKKITPKQQKFIDAYLELGNATEAAKRAGYKCRNDGAYNTLGAQNVRKLKVFIDERMQELKSSKTADLTEVMEFLTSVLRGEVSESVFNPVTGEREDIRANVRTRVDAARELLKRYPNKLDNERQKLLLEKLRAEIEDMRTDNAQQVFIVDDIGSNMADEGGGEDGI